MFGLKNGGNSHVKGVVFSDCDGYANRTRKKENW